REKHQAQLPSSYPPQTAAAGGAKTVEEGRLFVPQRRKLVSLTVQSPVCERVLPKIRREVLFSGCSCPSAFHGTKQAHSNCHFRGNTLFGMIFSPGHSSTCAHLPYKNGLKVVHIKIRTPLRTDNFV
ncbi:unnamed protein product, partial [Pylaiella littoralis]